MGQKMGASEAAGAAKVMVPYLHTIFHGRYTEKDCGPRDSSEMRLLAECIDALMGGELPQLGDLLMQRFKALQSHVINGDWAQANQLEVGTKMPIELTTLEEKTAASRQMLLEYKVEEMRKKAKGGNVGG